MKPGKIINDDNIIRHVLINARTIAVVGLSPKPERDSNKVAVYLKDHGYKVIPVRPAQKEILEEKTYTSLDDIDEPIDIINVFRNSAQ
ncbi:MAG: CoA-binding protein, partial [Desulfobacterales bacterium]|nr:CoA-binding protein [Desulfobacterales bacterium]